jgi:cell division protein FtsZ
MIHFEIPKNQSSIIKVIGVGGGGSNAVNYMHSLGIEGVDFVVCNTDSQALALSPIMNKVQLGPHLTSGLGAGANPEIGKQSCEESLEDISKILKVNTRMVFITAGMGGGTGTGGAPVVAKICRDLGILTVGIVTTPFTYEGRKRMKQAQEGIERMREHVDTVLIISNDKLRQQFGNLPFTKAFAKADDILATAAKCITDVITTTGQINVDFADVCTVMKNGGVAILGSAQATGENRALMAVEQALNSPLLNDSDIRGAKWLLLNITSSSGEYEHTMDEAEAIQAYVQQMAGDNCDVILGMGHDPNLEDRIAVTVIATGFNYKEINIDFPSFKAKEPEKINFKLEEASVAGTIPDIRLETKIDAPQQVDLTPVLVEMPEPEPMQFYIKETVEATYQEPVQELRQEMVEEPKPAFVYEEKPVEEIAMRLVLKKEEQVDDVVMKIGDRVLTADEIEEKRRFEEQKRALEERAERLRNMSFKIKASESSDDMENVPAYMRKKIDLDNNAPGSGSSHYSGYSVGVNDGKGSTQGNLQTINTYLEGKKPD